MDVSLRCFPMILDYAPGGCLSRVSGGFLINGNNAETNSTAELSDELGGHSFTPSHMARYGER